MDLSKKKALIIGVGTGGAAAGLFLARAGAEVTVLEKVAAPRAVGAGIGIAENGISVLASLGLDVQKIATPVVGGRIVDARGAVLMALPETRVVMARRSDLMKMMLDAVDAEPRIALRLGVEVLAVTADGVVQARGGGAMERLEADLVVGADGVWSRARDGGDFGARVRETGISYLRVLVGAGVARDEEAWTAAGIFGSFAVPDGTYAYASAGTERARAAIAARDLAGLRAVWAAAYGGAAPILDQVERFEDLLFNPVVRVDCARFVDRKLALVGDAAHAMPPNLGQGANSALVDAAVLAYELRRASSLEEGLAAYDARRRPKVKKVADTAARLGTISEWTSAPARFLRDRVLVKLASGRTDERTIEMVLQERPEALASMTAPTA